MKTAVLAITRRGVELGRRVVAALRKEGHAVRLLVPARFADGSPGEEAFTAPPARVLAEEFAQSRGLVLIMALGIVVRLLAPLVKDKRLDPAVVVMDEKGRFVISALSGHLGGANDLAQSLAGALGAIPVITTATDVQGRPAVDMLARRYALAMEPFTAVRPVNAALVNGDKVTFCSQFSLPLPRADGVEIIPWMEFPPANTDGWLVLITNRVLPPPTARTLFLRPRNLVAGIGCRRDIPPEFLREALELALNRAGCSPLSLRALATVDLRLHEPALHRMARDMSLPLLGFTREQIGRLYESAGVELSYSDFVYERIGVGGVCEAVALLASPRGRLLLRKTSHRGVTVALAEESSSWWEPDPEMSPI